jgi:hypothetical protein
MRLVVKNGETVVNELQFGSGPINIGRHADSQIFIPDRTVSRYHAVIYSTQDGGWMVEDLDSVNKTLLNSEPIHKAAIKSGDVLSIAEFNIEINLEDETIAGEPINLDDTIMDQDATPRDPMEPKIIIRRTDTGLAPDINLPAKRTTAFAHATEMICKAKGLDQMLKVLIQISMKQFNADHVWGALRSRPDGPMTAHAGKSKDGQSVDFEKLRLKDKITEVIDKEQFLLIPRIPTRPNDVPIHSALIAPISGEGGCFGVIYMDNDKAHPRYDISDLDYLMLISIHTSTIVENF